MFETSGKGSVLHGQINKSSGQNRMHEARKPSEDAYRSAKDESNSCKLSGKLQKTSTMRESLNKNEVFSPLSPKLASISAVDESSDMDYQSDENPFDISSILRAANEAGPQEAEAVEYKKASWNVLDYLTEESPKAGIKSPSKTVNCKSCWGCSKSYRNCGQRPCQFLGPIFEFSMQALTSLCYLVLLSIIVMISVLLAYPSPCENTCVNERLSNCLL